MTTFRLNLPEISLNEFNVEVCTTPYEEDEIPSPPPLLRMNCLNNYSPPFQEQMSRIYKLYPGEIYTFKQNYLLHSKEPVYNPIEIKGVFIEFHNTKVFWFMVDGELVEINYRNFSGWHTTDLEKNVTLYPLDK
jgi:hypothetical protein